SLSQQVAGLVRQVPGIEGVRNELQVVVSEDGPERQVPAGIHRSRPLDPAVAVARPAAGTTRTEESRRPDGQGLVWRPAAKVPYPPLEAGNRPVTAAPDSIPNTSVAAPLQEAVEALCRHDVRLAGVRPEVRGHVV